VRGRSSERKVNSGRGNSLNRESKAIVPRKKVKVIMTKKTPIKVIKRDERNRKENASQKPQTAIKTAQETARDMVNTVSTWVSEFQQKRRTETSRALQTLFPEPARPNEA
jgi:hypothetical protein